MYKIGHKIRCVLTIDTPRSFCIHAHRRWPTVKAAIHYASWRASCRAAPPFRFQMVTNRGNASGAHWSNLSWYFWGSDSWLFSSNCASVVWGLMHQGSAMDWKREEVLLLIECYRKHSCLWNSTLIYYKCKDRLKWYKNTEIRLRK